MKRSPEEQAQKARFEDFYGRSQAPVMLSIERAVCGCAYGGNSWTTRAEAQGMAALLGLRPGLRLLELGAGSGWPALYMAETSGCDVVLLDLPLVGLRIAAERTERDRLPGTCRAIVADAAAPPFPDGSFDAVSHSDLLCCLRRKRAVLEAARRVIRPDGKMVFTVISMAPGLSGKDYSRAVENGPEFIESESDYPTLLEATGWTTVDRRDISMDFADTCRRTLRAEAAHKDALASLIGDAAFAERQAGWQPKLAAIADGLVRRELFVATPKPA